jgi:serine/threonine-protein kinase
MQEYYGRYRVIRHIADGGNASIYLAENGGVESVLKVSMDTPQARMEAEIHRDLMPSDNLVEYRDSFSDNSWFVRVVEPFSGTVLEQAFMPHELWNVMLHSMRGMYAVDVSGPGYCFDDIKPENMLYKGGGSHRVALCDFASLRPKGSPIQEHTYGYCPPEVLEGHQSDATSVYGWGLSMEKVITGKIGITRCGGSVSEYVPQFGTEADDLLRSCTAIDPSARPTVSEAYELLQQASLCAQARMSQAVGCPD